MHTPGFFFFNDTATTEIYTLSLHDALPISHKLPFPCPHRDGQSMKPLGSAVSSSEDSSESPRRSEEHTSELQSHLNFVCRLLLEKKTKPRRPASILHRHLNPQQSVPPHSHP